LTFSTAEKRFARVCSVVRSSTRKNQLECEIDPLLHYKELPRYLQSASKDEKTSRGAAQLYLADFDYDKPVVAFDQIQEIVDGTLHPAELITGIRMVDIPLAEDEDEKAYVVTGIVSCKRTFGKDTTSPNAVTPITCIHTTHELRHGSLREWLFAELEVLKYGKDHIELIALGPNVQVIRLAVAIYDDDFNAYRGVYHGIGGVYLCVLNLGWHERETLRNIHPIMFIPHAAERREIYREMEHDLRRLEEKGITMDIRGEEIHVFVKLLLQITDMPQGILFCLVC
jgi:hypothetical protein